MKHVLITGGAGFIGSHTVDLFLQEGMRVTVLDNLETGKLSHLDLTNPNLKFIENSILNPSILTPLVKTCDAVLHLAALASVPQSIEDPTRSLEINTLGFLNVLEAIRAANRTIRLVYASSAAVYGNNQTLPCLEDSTHEALSPYALEKSNNERYAALYEKLFGIKSLGLRYFNVYGQRQDPQSPYSGVISKFLEHYSKNLDLTIFGDGEQSRDFIYVADVAKANLLAIQQDYSGILNIATAVPQTLNQLVRYIETAGKKPARLNYAKSREGDILHSYAAIDKAKKQLGFRATIRLEQGIQILLGTT